MDARTQRRFEARAQILKALAHPTRLFIVDQLSRKERCVCKLTDMVGADMSTVSKHLGILKGVGLVEDEKRGSQVFYKIRCLCVLGFLDCVESVLKETAKQQAAAV